uniref:Uncharacterized protein n=1 Tax=Lepeophtheirus salmonis TaxID=72036 RepID=A0A0K2TEG3_LEPSM
MNVAKSVPGRIFIGYLTA